DIPGVRLLMMDKESIAELIKIPVDEDPEENFINYLKQKNIFLISRNINDSTELMDAISAGADFAMGEFVGAPQTHLDEPSNIESYDLENKFGSSVF
ncbi:MAG: hypothetical protein MI865_12500, partial [Proteobacteria bacterium]|nr:hypothetical protein [Pseudomonadota bacterium]